MSVFNEFKNSLYSSLLRVEGSAGYSNGGNNTEAAQVIFGVGKQSITFLYAFKSGTDIKTTSNARIYVKLGYYFYDKVSDIDY